MHLETSLILVLPVFVLSVVAHECAHGLAALACGDPTARDRGRITLSPLPHVDLVGSVLLPLGLTLLRAPTVVGWAKPVPIDPARFRDQRNGPVCVALAGPAANFVLALVGAAVARLAPATGPLGPLHDVGLVTVTLNVGLGLFNLVPIPPLDGSWVLIRFLRLRHIVALHQLRWVGVLVVAVLAASPWTSGPLIERPVGAVVHATLALFGASAGVAP